jgi:hypothetical protein
MLFTRDFPITTYPHQASLNYDPQPDSVSVAPAAKSALALRAATNLVAEFAPRLVYSGCCSLSAETGADGLDINDGRHAGIASIFDSGEDKCFR